MFRIIDKETKLFLRDDLYYNEETEEALDVEPAQGLFRPKWNGETWVEDMPQEEIEALKNATKEPSETDLLKEQIKYQAEKLKAQEDAIAAVLDLQIL